MSRKHQDDSKLRLQETKFVAWLQTVLIDIDDSRFADEVKIAQWEREAVPMPKDDLRLLREFMGEHARRAGGTVTEGFNNVLLPVHEYGAAADTNAGRFLYYSNIVMEYFFDDREPENRDPLFLPNFAVWISEKAMMNDSTLFFQIAKLLERRGQGTLNKTSLSNLGLKTTSGRKKQPYDLEETFPLAALQLLALRQFPKDFDVDSLDDFDPIRPYYITRRELSAEIQYFQRIKGKEDAREIATEVLSRLINESGLVRFVRN